MAHYKYNRAFRALRHSACLLLLDLFFNGYHSLALLDRLTLNSIFPSQSISSYAQYLRKIPSFNVTMAATNDKEFKILGEEKFGESTLDNGGGHPTSYNEEQYHMSGPKLGIIIAGLCLALFLLGLDTAIVATVSNHKSWKGSTLTERLGNSENHRKIQLNKRYWMVWKCIFSSTVNRCTTQRNCNL